MDHKGKPLIERFRIAFKGIGEACRREKSLRIHFLATFCVIVFCLIFHPPVIWCAVFLVLCALVISLEMVNSALEAILDRLHPDHDPEIGFAKDCLAGAVMVASLTSVVVFIAYVVSQFFY